MVRKEETKLCECNECGKDRHVEEAVYCTRCGTKLPPQLIH